MVGRLYGYRPSIHTRDWTQNGWAYRCPTCGRSIKANKEPYEWIGKSEAICPNCKHNITDYFPTEVRFVYSADNIGDMPDVWEIMDGNGTVEIKEAIDLWIGGYLYLGRCMNNCGRIVSICSARIAQGATYSFSHLQEWVWSSNGLIFKKYAQDEGERLYSITFSACCPQCVDTVLEQKKASEQKCREEQEPQPKPKKVPVEANPKPNRKPVEPNQVAITIWEAFKRLISTVLGLALIGSSLFLLLLVPLEINSADPDSIKSLGGGIGFVLSTVLVHLGLNFITKSLISFGIKLLASFVNLIYLFLALGALCRLTSFNLSYSLFIAVGYIAAIVTIWYRFIRD